MYAKVSILEKERLPLGLASFLLLVDGTSFLLLVDGASFLILSERSTPPVASAEVAVREIAVIE